MTEELTLVSSSQIITESSIIDLILCVISIILLIIFRKKDNIFANIIYVATYICGISGVVGQLMLALNITNHVTLIYLIATIVSCIVLIVISFKFKKSKFILIPLLTIGVAICFLFGRVLNKPTYEVENEVAENTTTSMFDFAENIKPGQKCWVHSLERYEIEGTTDEFYITDSVVWPTQASDNETEPKKGVEIPYTFSIDGKEYSGVYGLGVEVTTKNDNNPKYTIEVNNLTDRGEIQLTIKEK